MNLRVLLYAAMAVLLAVSAMAQTKSGPANPATGTDYRTRLETNSAETQAEISALETELASAESRDHESLERQLIELKRQGEIRRLTILLEWANAEGDASRAAELQMALANWTTPAAAKPLPENAKSARAATGADLKTNVPTHK